MDTTDKSCPMIVHLPECIGYLCIDHIYYRDEWWGWYWWSSRFPGSNHDECNEQFSFDRTSILNKSQGRANQSFIRIIRIDKKVSKKKKNEKRCKCFVFFKMMFHSSLDLRNLRSTNTVSRKTWDQLNLKMMNRTMPMHRIIQSLRI